MHACAILENELNQTKIVWHIHCLLRQIPSANKNLISSTAPSRPVSVKQHAVLPIKTTLHRNTIINKYYHIVVEAICITRATSQIVSRNKYSWQYIEHSSNQLTIFATKSLSEKSVKLTIEGYKYGNLKVNTDYLNISTEAIHHQHHPYSINVAE